MRRLFARLRPPRGRHARAPREAVSFRMDNTDATWTWLRPDADPAAPTVLLPAMLDTGQRDGSADIVRIADGQPTPAPSTTDGAVRTMEHVGADETAFPALLAGMRVDLADDTGSLDPDDIAWEREFAELDRRLADAHMAFVRRWVVEVEDLAERVAPGWRDEPRVPVDTFEEARELAGVFVMPARAIDYSTAEYPAVLV